MPGAYQSRTVTEPQRERSRLKFDCSHQKCLLRLFDERSEIFREAKLHKNVACLACKKSQDFLHADNEKSSPYGELVSGNKNITQRG